MGAVRIIVVGIQNKSARAGLNKSTSTENSAWEGIVIAAIECERSVVEHITSDGTRRVPITDLQRTCCDECIASVTVISRQNGCSASGLKQCTCTGYGTIISKATWAIEHQ